MSLRLVVAALALAHPTLALACSGDGAGERIAANERYGLAMWLGSIAATALAWRLRRGGWLGWTLVVLAALHPGWWMSARGGDCGFLLVGSGAAFTVAVLALAAGRVWRAWKLHVRAPSRSG